MMLSLSIFFVLSGNCARKCRTGAITAQMMEVLLFDLATNNPADCRASHRADGAAASQDGSAYCADTCTDGGIFISLRHAGTARQGNKQGYGYCING